MHLDLRKIRAAAGLCSAGLLPEICSFCGRVLPKKAFPRGICSVCLSHMPLRPPGEMRHFLPCGEKREMADSLPLYVFLRYEGEVRRAVTGLKFHDRTDFALSLADLAALSWERQKVWEQQRGPARLARIELIIPLPLGRNRRRERGYNQAGLLAANLARNIGLPCRDDILLRKRGTLRQSETGSRAERLSNVRGAFVCVNPAAAAGRSVALLDDVCSSGASLWAAAEPLLAAGAEVTLLALAGNIKSGSVDF